MAILQRAVLILALATFAVAGNFQSDVVMKMKGARLPKMGSSLGKLLSKARRLDAHEEGGGEGEPTEATEVEGGESDMTPEQAEAMMKCYEGTCKAKLEALEGADGISAVCEAMKCFEEDAENCAAMTKMMEESPDMGKGMVSCLCGSGCEVAALDTEDGGEPDYKTFCPALTCITGSDKCTDFLASDTAKEMSGADCMCSDLDKIETMMKSGMGGGDGVCKGEPMKKDKDGKDEVDPCKMAKDGACAKAILPGWMHIQTSDKCTDMKKSMNADIDADEQKCIDDLVAAQEATADFAWRHGASLSGLVLVLGAALN